MEDNSPLFEAATEKGGYFFRQYPLVDNGVLVDNAVYLVGSDSYGYFRDKYDRFTQIHEMRRGRYKYENYIKWTKE